MAAPTVSPSTSGTITPGSSARRPAWSIAAVALACAALAACGGGGGGSSSSGGGSGTPRPRATRTPTATPLPGQHFTLYVRTGGNDANPGTEPDLALKTLAQAAKMLRAGTTVYVGPGRYRGKVELTRAEGTPLSPILFIADVDGTHTHDRRGEVIVDANGDTAALVLTRSPWVSFEGFLFTGAAPRATPRASGTAIQIRTSSDHVTIRDSIIGNGAEADGVRINDAADVLLFNNLIFNNDRGVVITGAAPRTRIINTTIAGHLRHGVVVGVDDGAVPTGTMIVNTIIQENDNTIAISVSEGPPSGVVGYDSHHNLIFEPGLTDQTQSYRPPRIRAATDINTDAGFENLPQGDVRLTAGSPAIDKGTSAIGADLVEDLTKRSATVDGRADRVPLDLGYHYRR